MIGLHRANSIILQAGGENRQYASLQRIRYNCDMAQQPPQIPPPLDKPPLESIFGKKPGPDSLPRWEVIWLVFTDCAAILVFVITGRASHRIVSTSGPVIGAINTAVPFMVAWLVVGAVAGLYTGKALYPVVRVIWRTALAGLIAGPLGVVLREALTSGPELIYFEIEIPFLLVATGMIVGLEVVWRVVWSRIRRLWWPELP